MYTVKCNPWHNGKRPNKKTNTSMICEEHGGEKRGKKKSTFTWNTARKKIEDRYSGNKYLKYKNIYSKKSQDLVQRQHRCKLVELGKRHYKKQSRTKQVKLLGKI